MTFEEIGGKTLVVLHELYSSQDALDAAGGASDALVEVHEQLDQLLVTMGASAGQSSRRSICLPGAPRQRRFSVAGCTRTARWVYQRLASDFRCDRIPRPASGSCLNLGSTCRCA